MLKKYKDQLFKIINSICADEAICKSVTDDVEALTKRYFVEEECENKEKKTKNLNPESEIFNELFNRSDAAIYVLNEKGEFLDVNQGVINMYGYDREFFIGERPEILSAPGLNDLEQVKDAIQNVLKGGKAQIKFWGVRRNGEVFPKDVGLYHSAYLGEEVVIAIARDITSENKEREVIYNERQLLRTIIDSAPYYITVKDKECCILFTNSGKLPLIDIKGGTMKGKTDIELFPAELAEGFLKDDLSVITEGKPIINKEEFVYTTDGGKIWLQTSKVPLKDEKGEIIGLVGFGNNITEQKQTEKVQQMLYEIARATIDEENLTGLLRIVQKELNEVIDTSNFYCALLDVESDMLYTPYDKDDVDDIKCWPADRSMTGYGIKHQQAMLLKASDFMDLVKSGEVDLIGTLPECWLSVPLYSGDESYGALVTQSYTNPDLYTEKHKELFVLIAHELSAFIFKKRVEIELIKAKEKAEESDKLKSTFLANMSHEIRTPMNAIVGFSELINDDDLEADERELYTDIIQQRASDLLTLIDDILDISKIEAGQINILKSRENIQDIIRAIYESTKMLWVDSGKSNVDFVLKYSPKCENLWIETDAARVRQIITNLLNNAFKFTDAGQIELGCELSGEDWLEISVKDTGLGIDLAEQSVVFERFAQLGETTGKHGGAGLGLTICKGLVEKLGGKITLESVLNQGSRFGFTLPV